MISLEEQHHSLGPESHSTTFMNHYLTGIGAIKDNHNQHQPCNKKSNNFSIYETQKFMLQRTMQSMQKAIVMSRVIVKVPQLPSVLLRSSKKRNCNSQGCTCTALADMPDMRSTSSSPQISVKHSLSVLQTQEHKSNHPHAPPLSSAPDYSHHSNYPHYC